MEKVVPWARLVALVEPHYPKGLRGHPPIGVERMLRIYFLQQWYTLADEALEDALYDSQALRTFAKALVDAKKRGVDTEVILDKSQRIEKYSSADFVAHEGIPTDIEFEDFQKEIQKTPSSPVTATPSTTLSRNK